MARLVLEPFGRPLPPCHEPFHFSDRRLCNNAIENLRWVPVGTSLLGALWEGGREKVPHLAFADDQAGEGVAVQEITVRFGGAKPGVERILDNKTYKSVKRPSISPGRYRRGEVHHAAVLTPDKIESAGEPRPDRNRHASPS